MLVFDTYEDEGRGKRLGSWKVGEFESWKLEVEKLESLKVGSWEVGEFESWKSEVEKSVTFELEVGKG